MNHLLTALSIATALLLGACGGGGEPGDPNDLVPGADAGTIVFTTDRTGDAEVFRIRPDGSGLLQLTNSPGLDRTPALSHDGASLVFTSERVAGREVIFIANADGGNPTRLTINTYAGFASFTHDDARVLYSYYDLTDRNWEVWAGEQFSGGSSHHQLISDGLHALAPAASPDGSMLAYESAASSTSQIRVRIADGPPFHPAFHISRNTSPDFSPDSTRIAFDSDRDARLQIYVMDIDGGNLRRLTDNTANDKDPTWSPDGTRIAFQSDRGGDWDIWVMDADGGNLTNLTNSPGTAETEPFWGRTAP